MATAAKFDADFSQFVGELNKVEVKLREFDADSARSSTAARKLADSLNGNKLAEQAAVAARAIQSIEGGVSALTSGELKRMGSVIDEATNKFAAMGRSVPDDIAKVKRALDDARAPAEQLGTTASTTGGGFSSMKASAMGAVAGIAGALTTMGVNALKDFAANALETGGKVADLAAKTGLTTEEVQTFGYAAQLSGSSMETMTGAVSKLSNNLVEGNDSTLAALKSVGLSLSDLRAMKPGEAFAAVAEAVKGIPDPMKQTQVAMDLLGKSGAELLPAMKAGFSETAEEAKRLGLVINEDSIKALDDLGDKFDTVYLQASVAFANMVGAFQKAMNAMRDAPAITVKVAFGLAASNAPKKGKSPGTNIAGQAMFGGGPGGQILAELYGLVAGVTGAGAVTKEDLGVANAAAEGPKGPGKPAAPAIVPGKSAAQIAKDKAAAEAAARKGAAARVKRQAEIDKLSGADIVASAIQSSLDVSALKGKIGDDQAAKIFGELLKAKDIAKAIKPEAVKGIEAALSTLASNPGVVREAREQGAKILKSVAIGLGSAKASDFGGAIKPGVFDSLILGGKSGGLSRGITGALGKSLGADITYASNAFGKLIPQNTIADTYALKKGLDGLGIPLATIDESFDTFIGKTDKWSEGIAGAAAAFGTLAQVTQGMGGGLDKITGGIGAMFAAGDAGKQFASSIGQMFGAGANFGKSKTAAGLGGAMAGFAGGASLAALTGTTSKTKGALAGAAGGAMSGAMAGSVAGPIGAGIGAGVGAIAGAIGGMLSANKAAKEARALMESNRKELLAFYGSREELIKQSKRLGISEAEVNRNILNNEKDTKSYAKTVEKLTELSEKERKAAEALSKSLGDVVRVRGVMSKQQTKDVRAALAAGEGAPQLDVAREFMASQRDSLLQGLQGALESGPLSPQLVASIGEALPAAFAELQRAGMSTNDALRTMEPILQSFQKNAVAAGLGSTPGFDALNTTLGILNDEKLGPLVNQAGFASQSLAALQNMGYLTQASFDGFAGSITGAYDAISASSGAEQALGVLQQPLQNLWQLQQDFGFEVDESTQALLTQAEAAGKVGDNMRPAAERAAEALDKVVERLDELIAAFKGDLVAGSKEGASDAGKAIVDTFAGVRPKVVVEYEYSVPDPPDIPTGNGTGSNAARTATGGNGNADVYMDGERVGFVVGRHLGKVSDFAGA